MSSTLSLGLLFVLLTITMALFSSLSHEIIHGHPTQSQRFNDLLVGLPLALYPYYEYKRSHLKHHIEADLTRPKIDPESFFVTQQQWGNLSAFCKGLKWINMTLLGRLLLGPAHTIYGLGYTMLHDLFFSSMRIRLQWISYCLGAATVLAIAHQAGIPIWLYALSAYCSLSVIAVRSFFEHRPAELAAERTVIVESCLPFRMLYLYNNFHAVHHKYPTMAWYQIHQEFRLNQQSYLERNGRFHFTGYGRWLKNVVTPVAHPVHPHEKN